MGKDHESKREQGQNDPPEQAGNTNSKSARPSEEKKFSWLDTILITILFIIVLHSATFLYLTFLSAIHKNKDESDIQQTIDISTKAQREIIILLADDNNNVSIEDKKTLVKTLALIAQAKQDIDKEHNSLLDMRQSVYSNFWGMFSLLIVLGGSVGAVAYVLMKHDLLNTAASHVKQRVNECADDLEDRIDKRISYSSLMAEAKAYQGMSYIFWDYYEIDFQETIKSREKIIEEPFPLTSRDIKLTIRDIELAKYLVKLGIKRVKDASKNIQDNRKFSIRDHDNIFKRDTNLFNHFVYHCAAERILNVVKDDPNGGLQLEVLENKVESKDFLKALKYAYQLLERCKDNRIHDRWYEIYDSVGFCLAISRDKENRQKGMEILSTAIVGRGPAGADPTPDDKKRKMWEEHDKRFGLGLPKPADGTINPNMA